MADIVITTLKYQDDYNDSVNMGNMSLGDLPPDSSSLFVEILRRTYLITLPIICMAGVVGNLLAFLVFVSKPLRRTSCSSQWCDSSQKDISVDIFCSRVPSMHHWNVVFGMNTSGELLNIIKCWYLAARSISDGGFLFATFLTWTSDASKLKFFHTDGLCQMIVFMTYVFAFLSVWLTVIVTIENYIRICRPFSVQAFCNVVIAKRTIAGLFLLGIIMYNYPFWTSKVFVVTIQNTTNYWCNINDQYRILLKWLSFWDMLITLVIPSLMIIVLMIAITFSLIKSLKRQSRLQSSSSRSAMNNDQMTRTSRSKRSNSSPQAKVTRMLFAVSFFFILLNGPSHVIRLILVIDAFLGSTTGQPSVQEQVHVVFQFIYYLSFAVNLIIYLTCGDNFRKQFKETYFFLCVRHNSPKGHSEMTAMSIIKLEEIDHRNEDQTALIDNGANADNDNAIRS